MLCRPGNHIERPLHDTIVKSASTTSAARALQKEANYYRLAKGSETQHYFPTWTRSGGNWLEMQYIEGKTLSEHCFEGNADRIERACGYIDHFTQNFLLDRPHNYIELCVHQYVLVPTLRQAKLLCGWDFWNPRWGIIHGDLHFDNIIVTTRGDVKFVDPRGEWGGTWGMTGDKDYDLAKLNQSVLGYNTLLHGKNYKYVPPFEVSDRVLAITVQLLWQIGPFHDNPRPFIELGDRIFEENRSRLGWHCVSTAEGR